MIRNAGFRTFVLLLLVLLLATSPAMAAGKEYCQGPTIGALRPASSVQAVPG